MKKTKIHPKLRKYSSEVAIGVMAVATVFGTLEIPEHLGGIYILPGQQIKIDNNDLNDLTNPIRRESEETSSEYISYSQSQRTPARSAKY